MGQDKVLLAGQSGEVADSSLQVELQALIIALIQCRARSLKPDKILTDCLQTLEMIEEEEFMEYRRYQGEIQTIKQYIVEQPDLEIAYCPRDINTLADALAAHGRTNPRLSLYHMGVDRPRWLEDQMSAAGLHF